jgi:hypothetical protein
MNLLEQIEHPEKWYIPVTQENQAELNTWWRMKATKSEWIKSEWIRSKNAQLNVNVVLVSEHPYDNSYYYCASEGQFNRAYPSYQKITLEQFRQITNPNLK